MWKNIFSRNIDDNGDTQEGCMPRHVAVIMDGNGRWAKARGLPRTAGHKSGVGTLKKIVKTANNMGIEVLTVYAFSTENWKRPAAEVEFLMALFAEYLQKEIREMHEENVRIKFIGRLDEFSPSLRGYIADAQELTKNNTGIRFNVAANYGGRDEIVRAAQKIAVDAASGKIAPSAVSDELFETYLDTFGNPPVDLMIRTSGDMRLSNFLLWQSAYAEFYFTETNWPDFSPEEFQKAVEEFTKRSRRFGGL